MEEIKLLLKRLCLSTGLFSKSSELLSGDTVTGSLTPRFTERPPFFNVTIPTWTLTSFSTLSGSFFSLFARDGLKYFERLSSFLDQNAVKVKSGFDAVTDVFCMALGEPFSLSILKLIIFPHLWQNIAAVAHFFATK